MSNRRRIPRTSRSYADRVQRRSVPKRLRSARPGLVRPWLAAAGWVPAGLAVTAEAGHLTAAYLEWPDSATRGWYHAGVAALLGLAAALVFFGSSRALLLGVGLAGPVLWLAGSLSGASPYRAMPDPAAAATTVAELVVAATLLAGRHADRALRRQRHPAAGKA